MLSGLMMAIGIFHLRLAEIVPVARDAVVEGMQDALIVLDTQARVVDMNTAAQNIIGVASSKVVGQSVAQLLPAWPDRFGAPLEGTEPQSEIMLKESGEERYYDLRFSPLRNRRGVVTGGTVVLHDITERKRMEEALRRWGELYESLVEATGAAVIRLDKEGKRTFVSGSAMEFYGRTREELIGGWVGDNDVPEDRDTISRLLQRIFETGEPVSGLVTRQEVRGTTKYVSSNWEPIKDAEGSVVEVQMTATDITEQMEGEQRRLEVQRMEALGKMAGGIAHDVNNILAMEILWAEIAKTKTDSAEVQEAMDNIISAAQGGSEIMRRLQRFGQPLKAGVQETVDLNQVISDSILFTRPMWKDQSEAKDIYIEIKEELLDVPPVRGDSAQLKEVVVNLILNAVEALPGGGDLSLRTYQDDDGVCVSVSDTGIGMDEDEKARIFDPYYTTKGEHGTGLGLPAVQGIVRSHGGEVKVSSQKGKGSTFVVCFPISSRDADEEVRAGEIPDELIMRRSSGILVVDDEPLVRKAIGGVLKERGYPVVAVADGMKALAALREEEYGLVLLDLGMPGMNGYQTAEEMKKLKPDVPVILVTGWGDDVDRDRMKEIGIIRVVHKPFQPGELTRTV
jgi:PAS domain S-box-containing protein